MSKIILLSSHFLPNDGGIARMMTELYKYLKKENKNFSAILLENEIVKPDSNIIQIKQFRIFKEIVAYRHLRKHKGIIISALWYPDALIASFSKAQKKIVLVHGTELLPNNSKFKEFFLKKLRRRVINNADVIIANSQFTADLITKNFRAKTVKIIHPGTDTEQFSPSNKIAAKKYFDVADKFVLSTLSVIRRHKGLETILESLAKIPLPLRTDFLLMIGGKGPAVDYYKKMCHQKGISQHVRWLGYIAEKDLPNFYRASDIFLLTSVSSEKLNAVEGFGMVLTEAQACGTPVIGTKSGGIIDAIEEGNGGFLIDEKDSKKLKDIILMLHQKPELLCQAGEAAKRRIKENLSWKSYYEKLKVEL